MQELFSEIKKWDIQWPVMNKHDLSKSVRIRHATIRQLLNQFLPQTVLTRRLVLAYQSVSVVELAVRRDVATELCDILHRRGLNPIVLAYDLSIRNVVARLR